MLALVDGEPRLLNLKQALRVYLNHRLEIVRRRSEFRLERARQREHILEGLMVALANLDEVIDTIKRSRRVDTARKNLRRNFKLSEEQANAILNTPLRRLAALERKKIETEHEDIKAEIKDLEGLLGSPKQMRQVIAEELTALKEQFDDQRRTQIVAVEQGQEDIPVRLSKLAPDKTVWVSLMPDGLISRNTRKRRPRISGTAAPAQLIQVNTRDTLFLVTTRGDATSFPVHSLPEFDSPPDGVPFHRVSPLSPGTELAAIFSLPPKNELATGWYVMSVTHQGMVKKTPLEELPGPAAQPFILVKVNQDDSLGWIRLSDGKRDVLLLTSKGMAIRFSEEDVRPMGMVAAGVLGIKLEQGDQVAGITMLPQRGNVFLLASNGYGKRLKPSEFPTQGRYGKGVIAWKLPDGVQLMGCTVGTKTSELTIHLREYAAKMAHVGDASLQTRSAVRGTLIQEIRDGDKMVAMNIPWEVPRPVK